MQTLRIADLLEAWQVDYSLVNHSLVNHGQEEGVAFIQPRYQLAQASADPINLSQYLGCHIELRWLGTKGCRNCNQVLSRQYGGGYCYDCFSTLAQCDLCIVSPDRCHWHAGTCREPDWADTFCMQPHIVYIAATSDLKVGISRATRVMQRWIDQGAHQGLILAHAPTRRCAGMLEAFCAQVTQDRTDWRRLVRGETARVPLADLADQLRPRLQDFGQLMDAAFNAQPDLSELADMTWALDEPVYQINHPVEAYSPPHRLACSPEEPVVSGTLHGIIGHFLLLDCGVLDLQAHDRAVLQCVLDPSKESEKLQSPQGSLF